MRCINVPALRQALASIRAYLMAAIACAVIPCQSKAVDSAPIMSVESLPLPCLAVSRDGLKLAVGGAASEGARIHVHDLSTLKVIQKLASEGKTVNALTFSADSSHLVAAINNDLLLWHTSDGRLARRMSHHSDVVYGVAASQDGKHFVSVGEDGRVCLWDAKSCAYLKDMARVERSLNDVAIHQRNGTIAVVGEGYFRLWNSIADEAPRDIPGAEVGPLYRVRFSNDGSAVAAVGVRGCVVAKISTDKVVKTRTIQLGPLCDGVAWLQGDRAFAVGTGRSVRALYNDETARPRRIGVVESLVRCIEFDYANDRLIVAGTSGAITVWNGKEIVKAE